MLSFIEAHESAELSPITINPDVQMQPSPHPPPLLQQPGNYVLDFCRVFSPQSPVYSHHVLFTRLDEAVAATAASEQQSLQRIDLRGPQSTAHTSISWVPNRNQAEDRSNGSNDHQGVVSRRAINAECHINATAAAPSPPEIERNENASRPCIAASVSSSSYKRPISYFMSVGRLATICTQTRKQVPDSPPPSDWAHIAKPLPAAASPEPGMASVRARGPRHLLAST
ncbi:hypothetical protein PCANC_08684 [Puccinia coronata f. sp. avenae]|uniref:Uncharacterized protein n=1 Tax=Puccinia coronata f. sp. avenae TaxID=200324 RepID=A0A2N5T5Y3_9BASI|nr:hypothetical protein PCANC_08684 [Puccinia coronata f. sp. avenae]